MVTVKFEGVQGSGKTLLMNKIEELLRNEDIVIFKGHSYEYEHKFEVSSEQIKGFIND